MLRIVTRLPARNLSPDELSAFAPLLDAVYDSQPSEELVRAFLQIIDPDALKN